MQETRNAIGLDVRKSQGLAEKLNKLLADYQVFYMNVRGFHWNIRGEKFFELHLKFEELYNNLILKIDEVAERILTLNHIPVHSYGEYLQLTDIAEERNVSDGTAAVAAILQSFKTVIIKQRELLALSSEAEDEGTNALMSDFIREQEKLVWMYSAYLNRH